ncbi:hypothetical protein ARMSODRAFT_1089847 [Armillaria solidipes]|uniref:Uncharacterized protein n=1 Tax=Armillaria solidipes TaxID=1076256 RepID=A0A2H3B970_9AGAR|nr:hypothetical protein ARMSODRAFT_1089847 [Armillaria solidipes]
MPMLSRRPTLLTRAIIPSVSDSLVPTVHLESQSKAPAKSTVTACSFVSLTDVAASLNVMKSGGIVNTIVFFAQP